MLLLRATSRRLTHVTRRTISSTRGEGVAGFKVMEVLNAANIMEAGGADVLHMEVGQPSTPAPPTARRVAEAALSRDEALGYTSANGLPAVKERTDKKASAKTAAARVVPRAFALNTMGGSYDEVDLEDMDWNPEMGAFTYQCPCGDLFQITPDELRAGEEIGTCPSCSLVITVVYDPDDLKELIPEGF